MPECPTVLNRHCGNSQVLPLTLVNATIAVPTYIGYLYLAIRSA